MHSCPECDQACYCDMDDTDLGECDDCIHECDPDDIDDYDYEHDDIDDVANAERDARV